MDLRLNPAGIAGAPLEVVSSRARHLWNALCRVYDLLGLDRAAGGGEVFRDLVLARIIEPTSKQDSLRVLSEVGVQPVSYRTVTRRLPVFANDTFRLALSAACAAHAGLAPASLVLYDVSTVYFQTDAGDGFREPGFSKERRLDPADHHRSADRRDWLRRASIGRHGGNWPRPSAKCRRPSPRCPTDGRHRTCWVCLPICSTRLLSQVLESSRGQ